jgi:mono/diheme cytochrome c family protein
MNWRNFLYLSCATSLASLPLSAAKKSTQGWWSNYDYSQISSQVVSRNQEPALLRGQAIKLGLDKQKITAYYDTGDMNLRYVALDAITFNGTPWNGSHGGNSLITGDLLFSNKASLAWAYKGSWKDPRKHDYAPLPDQYVEYHGSYRFNQYAVQSYSVGDSRTQVLECPTTEQAKGSISFTRHFNIAEVKENLKLKVLDNPAITLDQDLFISSNGPKIQSDASGLQFIELQAGQKNLHFSLTYSKHKSDIKSETLDLSAFLKGGETRWPQIIELAGQTQSDKHESFVVDQIPLPINNPWKSKIRFSGFDYFADGKRAAFCTWNGDIWIASGLDQGLNSVKWKRFAAGLNETLGLRIIKDTIYVNGKDQITRLHDFNNDNEADFYECFNNDSKITKNFHEFTFGLQTDAAGNFYIAKASPVRQGGRGFETVHDYHGTIVKVSPDGQTSEIFANGLRAPGGLAVNAEGTIVTTGENEGTYVPACKINYLKKGDFAGVIHDGNGRKPEQGYDKPLCFMPMDIDNSGGGQVWVPKGAWGDFGGSLLHLSYGRSKLYSVLKEEIDGQTQGGVLEIPVKLMSSGMRARFNPTNKDELIISGFKGWQTNAPRESSINRIRYTGEKFQRATDIKATKQGLYLTFNTELDAASANDLGNYSLERWNYLWCEQYGSAHFATNTDVKTLDKYKVSASKNVGKIGIPRNRSGELVYVTRAQLLDDKKTVFLKVHDMKPVDQMRVNFSIKSAAGKELKQEIHNTVHKINVDSNQFTDQISLTELQDREKLTSYALGSEVSIFQNGQLKDVYSNRLLALQTGTHNASPSVFTQTGKFKAIYSGYLQVTEKDQVTFKAQGSGDFIFELNDQTILNFKGQDQTKNSSKIDLVSGFHKYKITFHSPDQSASRFSLLWDGIKFPMSPISPNALRYQASPQKTTFDQKRSHRVLISEKRCASCHTPEQKLAMPELNMDSPSLKNAGGRFNEAWLAKWIANPKAMNPHSHMPRLTNAKEAQDIAAFLASDVQEDLSTPLKGDTKNGASLFYDLGCISCHTRADKHAYDPKRRSLNHLAAKFKPTALKQFLQAPEQNFHWTKMPNFNLSAKEATDLASYLIKASEKTQFPKSSGNASKGKKLFAQKGCVDCHGGDLKSTLKAPSLEKTYSKNTGCLSRKSKIDMGLNYNGKKQIHNFLKHNNTSLTQVIPQEFASRQIKQLNCNACHLRDNLDAQWQGKITEIKDLQIIHAHKGHLDQSRPQLTFTGEKLNQKTIEQYLDGSLPYQTRDWLLARMPSFPARAKLLAEGLALEHASHHTNSSSTKTDTIEVGKKLVGANGGFACIICHDVGDQAAMAAFEVKGINLKHSADRLNENYYLRWMLNPTHIVPDTKMPKYADDQGKSPMADLNNDATQQFEAIYQYLKSIK